MTVVTNAYLIDRMLANAGLVDKAVRVLPNLRNARIGTADVVSPVGGALSLLSGKKIRPQ